MARRRDDDYDDDDRDDDRPRSRRGDDYDDRDDDYDDRPARRGPKGPVDGMLENIAIALVLALFSFCCCPLVGLVVGGIGVGTSKNPDVKRNSIIVLVAAVLGIVVNVILVVTGQVPNFQAR